MTDSHCLIGSETIRHKINRSLLYCVTILINNNISINKECVIFSDCFVIYPVYICTSVFLSVTNVAQSDS